MKNNFPDILTVQKKKKNRYGRGKDIQKAIDRALSSGRYCTVYIPCGLWILDQPLRLHPLPDRTPEKMYCGNPQVNPEYAACIQKNQACIEEAKELVGDDLLVGINSGLHLMGARPAFGGDFSVNNFTVLKCTFKDAPAIDIQAGRATTISNMAIEGENKGLKERLFSKDPTANGERFPTLHIEEDDFWLDEGVEEGHVAIAIDRHPGSGSSQVLIDNVNARFFAGGISIGTSGHACTQNSENHLIRRFNGHYLGKAGILLGQDQTKGIKVTDSYFFGQKYWIDCVSKGLMKGFPPVISGCSVGITQRLFNLHHATGNFACHGLFVESTLSLGTIGWSTSSRNLPAVFTACQFNLYQQKYTRSIDCHLLTYRPLLFQGCIFKFNREHPAFFSMHNTQQVVFDTCTFSWKANENNAPIGFFKADHKGKKLVHLRHCSYNYQAANWDILDGAAEKEALSLGTLDIQQEANGSVSIQKSGIADVVVGDLIGFDGDYWIPTTHVPAMNAAQYPKSFLPFGIISEVNNLANDTSVYKLSQVASTVYQQLVASQQWNLVRWRTLIVDPTASFIPSGVLIEHISSGSNSEKTELLPVTKKTIIPATEAEAEQCIIEPYQRKVVYSERLTNIKAGEVIVVLSQFETTNDLGFNVAVASLVILANSKADIVGTEITETSGFNVSSNMHHGKTVEVGSIVSPGDYAEKYVNVLAYAASSAASDGDTIAVEEDYGRLTVLRFSAP